MERADDQAAIKKLIEEMTDTFNKHDGKAASAMYSEDARLTTVRGEVMKGKGAIEQGLSAIFASRAKYATQKTLDYNITFITPAVAIAHVTNELSGLVGPAGQDLSSHQELNLRVFAKQGNSWMVWAFHNTMVRPFETNPR
jgi:uncharacterized protein (TIGR02246 family)